MALGYRLAGDGKGPGRDGAGTCKEDDLCLGGVKGMATFGTPAHKPVDGVLYLRNKNSRIRPAAEDSTVIHECNPKGRAVVDQSDCLIKCKGPEGCGADPPLGETHTSGTGGTALAMMVCHITVKKVVIVPSYDIRVGANTAKAALNVARGNGVKRAADIQEGSETVGLCINMPLDVISEGRGGSLR